MPRDSEDAGGPAKLPVGRASLLATRLPPLNLFRAFESAAWHGSFTLAAQELGVTQSAISQQIAHLAGDRWATLYRYLAGAGP